MPFRVIVTGSRNWTDRYRVYDALDKLPRPLVVVHGDAHDGADLFAHHYCQLRYADEQVSEERHPAHWGTCTPDCRHRGIGYCPVAGFRRNGEMIDAGGDLVLAFVMPCTRMACFRKQAHDTHGTTDCITRARAAGIPVSEERG